MEKKDCLIGLGRISFWKLAATVLLILSGGSGNAIAQTPKEGLPRVTLEFKNEPLPLALKKVEQVSKYKILFTYDEIQNYKVTTSIKNKPLDEAIREIISPFPLAYKIKNIFVTIYSGKPVDPKRKISGIVIDQKGNPLPGVNIVADDSSLGGISDADGEFDIDIPDGMKVEKLTFSFIGQKKLTVPFRGTELKVVMEDNSLTINEVVVNGAFTRSANTFTGAVTTVKGEDLRRVGNQNLLQSLKNIDPSFLQIENLTSGSNPNALPNYQMRGSSTIADIQGEYASSANQPLFILDGFETELSKIMDLDINQVESVTTLKDATAKAMYGAKAANGVIVVETKRPAEGKLRFTYTGDGNIQAPDLSSYELANARQKLEVERMAGLYTSSNALSQIALDKTYNNKLMEILKGVDTDWLAQPIHTGVGQKHSLHMEGGNSGMIYGVDLSYNNIEGVMKGSDRNTFSGGVTLAYRSSKNFLFRNKLIVDYNSSNESPWGAFSSYAAMNPYSRIYNDDGSVTKSYNYTDNNGTAGTYFNPIYNTTLNTINNTSYTNITNNLYLEWQLADNLKLTGRLGIFRKLTTEDVFKSADHTDFATYTDEYRKGSYYQANGKHLNLNADAGVSYSLTKDKHLLFFNGQVNLSDNTYSSSAITAEGFPSDKISDISAALQYEDDGRPTGTEGISRSCGALASVNYSFDNKYLFDGNYRLSGSSEAGANNRWNSFWSIGGGWNIHNEAFLKESSAVKKLKLRGSYGYTGSQGFSSYDAMPTFVYYSDASYDGSVGSYVKGLANEDLHFQEKFDTNLGLDFIFLDRLSGRFDWYVSNTDGMITNVSIPSALGFSSYVANLGKVENKGFEAYLNYKLYEKKRNYINVYGSIAHNKNTLKKISNGLRAWNDSQDANVSSIPAVKYYEGQSMNAIWAVKSLGIDPQTGKEIFVKKDGTITYTYDVGDQVVCGDGQPKYNGIIGFNGEIRNFGFSVSGSYRWGGQIYNQTLVDKVENAALQYNVDKRVFTDRWQKSGDVALYKSISDQTVTYPTSRFVEDYNLFSLNSASVYYDFRDCAFMKASFVERLRVSAYTNDLFVISSVKTERGISYPFARTFSFSIQATF
ncbi:MAG: TonB-dependent receptor plug [Bacteroidetes bacterium]|nr:TonB-dependent receptor plug [Bacteroidota bacterium]